MRIAVTGANGFIGRSLVAALLGRGHQVRALVRFPDAALAAFPMETIATGPIETISDWRPYLSGVDIVIHLAARAHMPEQQFEYADSIRAINTNATLTLARSAARRKVAHFIYISSVGVHGDHTEKSQMLRADDPLNPQNIYAQSKVEAELGLRALHAENKMGITILRPPLVYGPGARGNFRALCRLVAKAPALPFRSIDNLRSLLAVDNLTSALVAITEAPTSDLRAFLLSDGDDFSLPEIIRLIASGLDKTCLLLPSPVSLLQIAGRLINREKAMQRLTQSLRVDSSDFRRVFNWQNAVAAREALKKAAPQCVS